MPDFSIVIPTYNRCDLLKKALESVLQQTHPSFEVLVVDNNSIDGTKEMVASLRDQRIRFLSISNQGVIAKSRNVGIAVSRSEWLCFLDSDDWWYPKKLEETLKMQRDADLIYHDLETVNEAGVKVGRRMKTRRLKSPILADLLSKGNGIATSGVAVRSDMVEKSEGFCESHELIGVEDYDLWIRIAANTQRFVQIKNALGAYRVSDSNNSKATIKQIAALAAIYKRNLGLLTRASEQKMALAARDYYAALMWQSMGITEKAQDLYASALCNGRLGIAVKSLCRWLSCYMWHRKSLAP
jgi:glycosyltransferase involved in cell wall biosynthesis